MPSAADGDPALFGFFVIDPDEGRQVSGEVRVTEDVAGPVGQDEFLRRHGGWTTGEAAAVGGNQASAVFGCEQHAVEDLAGGVGGRATRNMGEPLQGGRRQFGDEADGFGTFRELLGIERRIHRGGLDAATLERESEIPGTPSAECGELHNGATVGATGGFHGIRWDEETQRLKAVVADPGFEPVVEIGGCEADAVGTSGEQQVPEHR